jgi:S1-C subfamily serine protease
MRLSKQQAERVKRATVVIDAGAKGHGQGVLVNGDFVLTAAHCVTWDGDGEMALGDRYIEKLTTRGRDMQASVCAVDPVADIAALGDIGDGELLEVMGPFQRWCRETDSVPLRRSLPVLNKSLDVFILSHTGEWVTGRITEHQSWARGRVYVEADQQIRGGTSGGPIVDPSGQLVGVVSSFSESPGVSERCGGLQPFAWLALPMWVRREILLARGNGTRDLTPAAKGK